ncbi:MAG TPA: hypothetical protein VG225_04065 [Terracidiphilus sp.]|jgi:hypothetical protein|nr:hypothetical protein [Terracidiphilus sp.]
MHTIKMTMVLGAMLSAGMVMAQTQAPAQSEPQAQASQGQTGSGHEGRRHPMNPDKAAARLGKKLNLSADQVAQIKPIFADRQQQMQSLRADTSLSQEDRRAKMKAIHQDSKSKIEAVLNDQQKQQFEEMMQRRHGHHKGEKPQGQ